MIIAEIQTEYKGHKFCDCRVYYEDDQGEWKHTKKGIALNGEILEEVVAALKKAKPHLGEF